MLFLLLWEFLLLDYLYLVLYEWVISCLIASATTYVVWVFSCRSFSVRSISGVEIPWMSVGSTTCEYFVYFGHVDVVSLYVLLIGHVLWLHIQSPNLPHPNIPPGMFLLFSWLASWGFDIASDMYFPLYCRHELLKVLNETLMLELFRSIH